MTVGTSIKKAHREWGPTSSTQDAADAALEEFDSPSYGKSTSVHRRLKVLARSWKDSRWPFAATETTDFEWSIIQPLLPNKPRGKPRVDDRKVLDGIYWRPRAGSPWDETPERYGPPPTCSNCVMVGAITSCSGQA